MVLATAQGRTEGREGADFFPLTIDVEERMYAAGKIPGGFFKREGMRPQLSTLIDLLPFTFQTAAANGGTTTQPGIISDPIRDRHE